MSDPNHGGTIITRHIPQRICEKIAEDVYWLDKSKSLLALATKSHADLIRELNIILNGTKD